MYWLFKVITSWSAPLIQSRFRRHCCVCRCFLNELVVVCSTVWIRKQLWRKHFVCINVATFQKCFHFRNLFTLKEFEFWQLKIQLSHFIPYLSQKSSQKFPFWLTYYCFSFSHFSVKYISDSDGSSHRTQEEKLPLSNLSCPSPHNKYWSLPGLPCRYILYSLLPWKCVSFPLQVGK